MNDPENRPPPPQEWLDALDRGEADVAAGRTVVSERVLSRLRRTLAEMEARAIREPSAGDAPRR